LAKKNEDYDEYVEKYLKKMFTSAENLLISLNSRKIGSADLSTISRHDIG